MPLRLVPPRAGKSPNWTIRGTYLGVRVDRSSRTHRRSVAERLRQNIERDIERGEFPARTPAAAPPTFLSAAVAYMRAGKSRRYVARLIKHFGETPLSEIGQTQIDAAAVALCPGTSPGTRNATVYTPVSAILHHAGVPLKLRRPTGAKGRIVTDWLTPEAAAAIINAADRTDPELGLLLRFLLYTGVRLGEALALRWDDVRIEESAAWIRREKGGIASDVRLRAGLRDAMAKHREGSTSARVFRFHQGGHLKHQLLRAKLAALDLSCPVRRPKGWQPPPYKWPWVNFHSFRHTWATWLRKYAGSDVRGLVATGNWRDERSAWRYLHAVVGEEWDRVDRLPDVGKTWNARKRGAK